MNLIRHFIREICAKHGLEAYYFPSTDVYSIRFKGKGIQNFNSANFFTLPRRFREKEILALKKVGLAHNVGEKTKDQILLNSGLGKRLK
jgi:hypothetical protein